MNIDPQATTVLCYGDSNTFGQRHDAPGRYAADERWTGVLQRALGDDYYVIEEGLGGRTTHFDNDNGKPTRNGLLYFGACLESHLPLDVVVIMLGTNDLKRMYDQQPAAIATSVGAYVAKMTEITGRREQPMPQVLLVSPAHLDETAAGYFREAGELDAESAAKSRALAAALETVAAQHGCEFLDAATVATVGEDGVHLDVRSHVALGEAIAQKLRDLRQP